MATLATASTVSSIVSATTSTSVVATAPPQAGVLEGANPTAYNASNPIVLFIIQATIVIIVCQLLYYPLKLLRQPRVIAEVIGGIVLGPSVMMRIPHFQDTIFPTASMPVFNNVANLGLVIFLFLVALEVDIRLFMHNWKVAASVGLAGMLLPFGLGFAIAYGLYHQFQDEGTAVISFGVFGLFIGTALSITAFPVLCRILTELELLRNDVGVTVLAAGVGNDVVGWILLALCVALVNNASGLSALYALLCGAGWIVFLTFAVRPCFIWLLRRTGSLQNGPTQGMVALTMLMVLISAFFTQIVGIHAIFGAFLIGLICPHDGGFAIKMTEKIEDLISVVFLPLYFALSGLSTDLGLLNDGITWGYVIGVIVCAFAGKIIGGTLAARANKLLWRESLTIGCLMSCKGLVELIVLNIGFQAHILSKRTFTMFVVMALVTTVSTTPLTKALYPPWYQKKVERWRKGEIDWDGNPTESTSTSTSRGASMDKLTTSPIRRLLVHLRLESLPSLFTFITLLGHEGVQKSSQGAAPENNEQTAHESEVEIKKRPIEVHGLRILELTDRTSSVMQVTEGEEFYSLHDPVVNTFRTFSRLHDLAVSGRVAVAPSSFYAETLMNEASGVNSDFALIPWSEWGNVTEDQAIPHTPNSSERFKSSTHLEFIQNTLRKAGDTCNAGVFVNNGFGGLAKPVDRPQLLRTKSTVSVRSHSHEPAELPLSDKSHHVFFPFFGGIDDRVALRFVLQLAKNPLVSVTIAHMNISNDDAEGVHVHAEGANTDNGESKSVAITEKNQVVGEVTAQDLALLSMLQSSLPRELAGRFKFREVSTTSAKVHQETMTIAKDTVGQTPKNAGDIVVLGKTHLRLGDTASESSTLDLKGTLGIVADKMIMQGVKASVLVIQAGGRGKEL